MLFSKNLSNKEIAHLLQSIAAAYIIKAENRFKIIAYQRAATAVEHAPSEIKDLWLEQKLTEIPGVGLNIASYLDELFRTGKVKHFEQVLKGLPQAVFEFIKISGLGPRTAFKLCQELGIKQRKGALKKLGKAASQGKIRHIEGFGEASEKEILRGLADFGKRSERLLLPFATTISQDVLDYLKRCPQVKRVDPLGSLRRKCATVGDVDIAVASDKPEKVIDWFIKYPKKTRVVESGEAKARLIISGGYQIDLMVEPLQSYGSLLQHFTGSKEHNIHLRQIAQDKGMSLSEHGIKKKKKAGAGQLKKYAQEKDFYQALGMDWIPPVLREDTGEIKAAIKHQLPKLIKLSDVKGDLHIHSDFNIESSHDLGISSMKVTIQKAKELNYQYIAFSEHNPSTSKHNDKQIIALLKRKKEEIDELNYSREKKSGIKNKKLFIFNSLEIDIKPNGKRAVPDKALDLLDFAIVAVHSSFRLEKGKMTERILSALEHPKVKILAHPTGRKFNQREAYELDWDKIFDFCKRKNKFLEINSYPDRLDLPNTLVKEAIKNGLKLVLSTDAHEVEQLDLIKYGVFVAEKGWAAKSDIINTLDYNQVRKLLIS